MAFQYRKFVPGVAAENPFADLPRRVFEAHNQARVSGYTTRNGTYGGGLPALAWDDRAAAVAWQRAAECATRGTIGHDQDGDGHLDVVEAWAQMYGQHPGLGENLGLFSGRAGLVEKAMELWLASPTHQGNIFHDFTGAGVGHVGDFDGPHFIAVVFIG